MHKHDSYIGFSAVYLLTSERGAARKCASTEATLGFTLPSRISSGNTLILDVTDLAVNCYKAGVNIKHVLSLLP